VDLGLELRLKRDLANAKTSIRKYTEALDGASDNRKGELTRLIEKWGRKISQVEADLREHKESIKDCRDRVMSGLTMTCETCLCMTCKHLTECPVHKAEHYKGQWSKDLVQCPTRCTQVCTSLNGGRRVLKPLSKCSMYAKQENRKLPGRKDSIMLIDERPYRRSSDED
jgi:hypothetical protein